MENHIFIDSIINHFCDSETKSFYQKTKKIDNGEDVLLIKPLTEITHYLHSKFNNHTLLGNVDGRNFYAFDTHEGILLLYAPIPLFGKTELKACFVTYYEDKKQLKEGFLSIVNTMYDQDKTILDNIEKISPLHDDSNSVKNVMGRIASMRKSKSPIIFDKIKSNL